VTQLLEKLKCLTEELEKSKELEQKDDFIIQNMNEDKEDEKKKGKKRKKKRRVKKREKKKKKSEKKEKEKQ
jgi:hypothetical protein